MKYLLDTNALLWVLENNHLLTKKAKNAIVNDRNDIYVSIVSLWEIAIKLSIRKLELTKTLNEIIEEMSRQFLHVLPISVDAIRKIQMLPFHHRDPFDRIIIAQAQADNLIIITKDQQFDHYDIKILW
ncbi:type II toxin-antitoxin system VapC family toxin [Catalinimonas niigatensis]|uniref:type II toxin-antitoxin system VapC family toxin n=1 Tax=Catalinimonas niigatensis TaxID=1397264 RepID=UPI002666544A|nr:type II toxin-antitoxin system VapC family toxin [Catalinimonas niigatensis]WPP52962.1 type II toxin-antitoxin system VapC family toxin [Catalinimonas niigatensis]